jgi:PhoH-like ATPase
MRKNYILDANILIHDPKSILHFDDNTVIIPVAVLGEIDRFKKEMTDRGYSARAVVRLLDGLRDGRSLAAGVPLEGGGILKVYCDPRDPFKSNGEADSEILRVAQAVQEADAVTPVIIVTKDINLRIRADAAGFRAEDYETDRVLLSDVAPGHATRPVGADVIQQLKASGRVEWDDPRATPNEYLLLIPDDGAKGSALARVSPDGHALLSLRDPERGVCGIHPRNKEQYFAVDALLDDDIRLVTLMGKAGTGKTMLAMAAALHQVVRRRSHRCALVCRPIFPMGRDLGFLPGDVEKKLDPWMKPIIDTIEYLLDAGGPLKGVQNAQALMQSGLIEIQPLTYIRGRNIANRFVVIDEAQNLTPLEVKTVITRVGQDSKIVLTGDPFQIDNPYVDADSNGFTYLVNRFRGQAIAAHVQLSKGERSPLAELAANLL